MSDSIKDRVSTVMRMAGNIMAGVAGGLSPRTDYTPEIVARVTTLAWMLHDETLRQDEQRRQHALAAEEALRQKGVS